MSCHYGNPDCHDTSDNTHECPRPRASDAERLRAVMRGLAIADAEAHESITLGREDVRVLCIALRLVSLVEGRAILYEVAKHNPTFSQRVARERAAGRGGPGMAS